MNISGGFLWQFQGLGPPGVIIFFVLSGYLIAYTCDSRNDRLPDYLLGRLSRLYSVVLPAILLTVLLEAAGQYMGGGPYSVDEESYPVLE